VIQQLQTCCHYCTLITVPTSVEEIHSVGTINKVPYQLSHTWDQVSSRSRAPSSCKQSRRDQDVIETLSLGNIFLVV